MEKSQLILFNKSEINELVSEFDIKTVKKNGKTYVADDKGNIKCCDSCKREIETKKIGSIAHGSVLVFCDNPLCLSAWVAKNKI